MEWSVQECRFKLPSYHIALRPIMWMSEALKGRPRVEDVRAVWELEHLLSMEAGGLSHKDPPWSCLKITHRLSVAVKMYLR